MLAVHGYSPEGMENGRKPEKVWSDRLRKADQVLGKLTGMGFDPVVVFSGGGEFDGRSEAEHIREYASENFSSLVRDHELILEDESTDTEENVLRLHEFAVERGIEFCFVVSSKDHAPRVLKDWEKHSPEGESLVVPVVGSDKTYAASGKDPFIVEAAMYEPFVDALGELWSVDPDKYEEAAEEIREVLRKYR